MTQFFRSLASAVAVAAMISAPQALAAPRKAAEVKPETVGFDSARLKRLDDAMAKVVADGRVSGMTTLLVRHGQVVGFKTYGQKDLATGAPMEKDTIFRIYSMTKPITGVAMMILFEEGKWKLDDPVTKFIPEFKNLKVMTGVDDKGNMITVPVERPPTMREIMSHTAGFGYGLGDRHPVDRMFREKRVLGAAGLNDMITRIADIPLMFQPGTAWYYSVSVDIQGAIVERISGQTLGAFMEERIFRPLKMADTGFYVPAGKTDRLATLYMTDPKTRQNVLATAIFDNPPPDYTKPPAAESGGRRPGLHHLGLWPVLPDASQRRRTGWRADPRPGDGGADAHQRHPEERAGDLERNLGLPLQRGGGLWPGLHGQPGPPRCR